MDIRSQLYDRSLILDFGDKEPKLSWTSKIRRTATDSDFLQAGLAMAGLQGKKVKKIIQRDQFRLS